MRAELIFLDWLQSLRSPVLDQIMVSVTSLGDGGIFWLLLSGCLLVHPRTRRTGAAMLLALAMEALLCNKILKPLVARARPFEANPSAALLIAPPADFSFPSGHTGASFAAASALLFCRSHLRYPAMLLAGLIGFSRLYLYVHYPTDVLAGALLGFMLGWLGARIVRLPFPLGKRIGNSAA